MLFIAEIVRAKRAGGDKAISAGVVELDEKASAGDAADAAGERCTDTVGQKMRNEAVGGLPLRLHGAAFGGRNLSGDFAQRGPIQRFGCTVRAELACADERTVHGKVGVA